MDSYDRLKKLTTNMFMEQPIEEHPFFIKMKQNAFSMAQVKFTALQIYHVVDYFPRFISAIITNIPDYKQRMPLVENLFEEHGKMKEAYVHVETYKQFLKGIGLTEKEIEESRPIIPVISYTRAVTDLCLHYPYPEGLAALGVIEEIVARVSPTVAKYALAHFSEQKDSLVHFTDHAVLDVTHANEIYEVVAQCYDGAEKELVEQGLQLGMYYHRRLYTDILEALERIEQ